MLAIQSSDPYLFVSYRSLEAEFALRLAADLRNAGVRIWLDRLDAAILTGDDWRRALERALDGCQGLIAVVSPGYVGSRYCRNELARADDRQLRIIPLLIADILESWPLEIQRVQYLDFRSWRDEPTYLARLEILLEHLRAQAAAHIGQRPDAETRYLTSLVGRLEGRRGVIQYVDFEGSAWGRREGELKERPPTTLVNAWGVDDEFALLDSPVLSTSAPMPESDAKPVGSAHEAVLSHRAVVVTGEPGGGKTTLLERLVLGGALARLSDQRAALPVYLSLPSWTEAEDFQSFLQRHWPMIEPLDAALSSGEVSLFLDGLNEMGAAGQERVKALRRWIETWANTETGPHRLVVTCRRDDYWGDLDLELPRVDLAPLDEPRIRHMAALYLEENAETFLQRVFEDRVRGLGKLAANPYLLTAIMFIYASSGELPRNQGVLYRRLSAALWMREYKRRTPGWIPFLDAEPRFARLAFEMIETDQPVEVPASWAERWVPRDLLRVGASASLLVIRDDAVRFSHQLLGEALAASQLIARGLNQRLGSPAFHQRFMANAGTERRATKWDEVVIAATGLATDASRWIGEVARHDPFLAFICLERGGGVTPEDAAELIGAFERAIPKLRSEIEEFEVYKRREEERYGYYSRGVDECEARQSVLQDAIDLAASHLLKLRNGFGRAAGTAGG